LQGEHLGHGGGIVLRQRDFQTGGGLVLQLNLPALQLIRLGDEIVGQ